MDNTKFELWTPPVLDLSLDSFSNEIFQEFDKKRSIDMNENEDLSAPLENQAATIATTTTTTEPASQSNVNYTTSTSPISSSVTLPQSEREIEEETTSTTNLFRRSSTFLKNKLSLHNTGDTPRNSATSNLSTQQVEDISSIISRQYPPKPLQYSPIVDPPSDDIKMIQSASSSTGVTQQEEKRTVKDRTPDTPKKRSFFSLRFC